MTTPELDTRLRRVTGRAIRFQTYPEWLATQDRRRARDRAVILSTLVLVALAAWACAWVLLP